MAALQVVCCAMRLFSHCIDVRHLTADDQSQLTNNGGDKYSAAVFRRPRSLLLSAAMGSSVGVDMPHEFSMSLESVQRR